MLEWAAIILASVLGLCTVLMVGIVAFVLVWYSRMLTQATEIVIRHQDDSRSYERKCIADALTSGRQPANLSAGEPQVQERVPGAVRRLAGAMAEDADTLAGPL